MPYTRGLTVVSLRMPHSGAHHTVISPFQVASIIITRADSRLAPSQWETSLQSNEVSHWLGANLESALYYHPPGTNNRHYNPTLKLTQPSFQGLGKIHYIIIAYSNDRNYQNQLKMSDEISIFFSCFPQIYVCGHFKNSFHYSKWLIFQTLGGTKKNKKNNLLVIILNNQYFL